VTAARQQARSLLRIPAHRRVTSLLEGEYQALHPGRSTEFNDLREYVRGDDPKDLDWKASARARTLLVRRYEALRKLTVVLAVSTGRSMRAAATLEETKADVALAVAGLVGELAVRHGDLVGLVHGDAQSQWVTPPRGSAQRVDRALAAAAEAGQASTAPSDLEALLGRVVRSVRRRSFVVVVTDAVEVGPEVLRALRRLRVRHEVVVAVVVGLEPLAVAPGSPRAVLDVDTAAPVPAWLRDDERLRTDLATVVADDRARLEHQLDRMGISHVHVTGMAGVVPGVRELLERHRRAGR